MSGNYTPELPRSDSQEAEQAIEQVMAERHYPTNPAAAARAGFEAACRLLARKKQLSSIVQAVDEAKS